MDPVRLRALDKAIESGGPYDPDGSLLVRRARAFEAYLRGDSEDEDDKEPDAAGVELFSDANTEMYMAEVNAVLADLEWVEPPTHAKRAAELFSDANTKHADYIARVTGPQSARSATPDEIAAYNERMRAAADHSKGEV